MEFTSSIIYEIAGALFICLIAGALAYRASFKTLFFFFVLLIPFQVVDTRFGSINMALAYFITFALLIRKEFYRFPLASTVSLLLLGYLLSFSQVHPVQNWDHIFYLISFVSAILVFYLTYNFVADTEDYQRFFNVLYVMNLLVIAYCFLQVMADRSGYLELLPGLTIQLSPARLGWDMRLAGPFGSTMPGLFAEYLVISMLICFYQLAFNTSRRKTVFLLVLLAINFGALVATGNRGGLIGLVLFSILLLFLLRRVLGFANMLKVLFGGIILFTLATLVVINFTNFDRLFERLVETEIESGVPDTRAKAWPQALGLFEEKPWLGHGPRLRLPQDDEIDIPDHRAIDFPHNLYLYLLCTIGIVGLVFYAIFFASLLWRIAQCLPGRDHRDPFLNYWPRFALLIVVYVLFDQIKIEYARYTAADYWHFVFMIFGLTLGLAERKAGRLAGSSFKMEYQVQKFRVVRCHE